MRTFFLSCSLLLSSLAMSACGGGGDSTVPPPTGPEAEERLAAVAMVGDAMTAELTAENPVAPMMSFERDQPTFEDLDACSDFTGTFLNGSVTYNDCDTARGSLAGTTSWTWALDDGWTTTRDLTFTSLADSSTTTLTGEANWKVTLKLDGTRSMRRQGANTTIGPEGRVETASDLKWSYSRTETGITRSWPTGSATIEVFSGTDKLFDIALTFNGTATVTALINGEEYTFSLLTPNAPVFRRYT